MNLILHQFKTDLRHFRLPLAVLWLLFIAEPVLMCANSVSYEARAVLQTILFLGQVFCALFLIAALVQADPLVGTSAGWLTRPVRREHLFWAKNGFMLLCLLLPRLVAQSIGWAVRDYSGQLVLCAAGQSLLFSAAFVLVVAVLAALTRDLARFFLGAGITVGGMFAWVAAVETLKRAHLLHQAGASWNERPSFDASVLTAAFLFVIVGALVAWIAQAGMRRWRAGVIWFVLGLMAFPLIEVSWPFNFLQPRLAATVPLTLTLWETNPPVNHLPDQYLSTEMVLSGVPAGHVAVMQHVSASIKIKGERGYYFPSPAYYGNPGRQHPADSPQSDYYFQLVKTFFPAPTLWFNDNSHSGVRSELETEELRNRFTNALPVAKIYGDVELDLYTVRKIAELPLQTGTISTLPGQHVAIQNIRLTDGVITVQLSESTASLLFDRDVTRAGLNGNFGNPACTYILYHPVSGEAFSVRPSDFQSAFPGPLTGESRFFWKLRFPYPALRERFAGMTAAEWLREARLCVFAPVYAGTARQKIQNDHYTWPARSGISRYETANLVGANAVEDASLPANPTAAQISSYLDGILFNVPDVLPSAQREVIIKKLSAIGTNGLPVLLRRLPLSQRVEDNLVLPAVGKLATRDQFPELRSALQRDLAMVRVFTEKHWEADARDVLVARLSDHREPLPTEALRIIAEAKDPATYPDLHWHFLHLNYGHDRVLPALEQCPGFDATAVVREAWTRARLGIISTADLAIAAAKLGLPDALGQAVINLEGSREKSRRQRELAQLASVTGYDGPGTNTLAWVGAHLEQFSFDAAQQRYLLSSSR